MVAQCGEGIRQDALFDVRRTDSHLTPNVWVVVLPAAMSVNPYDIRGHCNHADGCSPIILLICCECRGGGWTDYIPLYTVGSK